MYNPKWLRIMESKVYFKILLNEPHAEDQVIYSPVKEAPGNSWGFLEINISGEKKISLWENYLPCSHNCCLKPTELFGLEKNIYCVAEN